MCIAMSPLVAWGDFFEENSVSTKDKLQVWVKPNKTEVSLNSAPATIAKAESLGWKKKATVKKGSK